MEAQRQEYMLTAKEADVVWFSTFEMMAFNIEMLNRFGFSEAEVERNCPGSWIYPYLKEPKLKRAIRFVLGGQASLRKRMRTGEVTANSLQEFIAGNKQLILDTLNQLDFSESENRYLQVDVGDDSSDSEPSAKIRQQVPATSGAAAGSEEEFVSKYFSHLPVQDCDEEPEMIKRKCTVSTEIDGDGKSHSLLEFGVNHDSTPLYDLVIFAPPTSGKSAAAALLPGIVQRMGHIFDWKIFVTEVPQFLKLGRKSIAVIPDEWLFLEMYHRRGIKIEPIWYERAIAECEQWATTVIRTNINVPDAIRKWPNVFSSN